MEYRKKPVVIEAIQYTGDNYYEIKEFCGVHPQGHGHCLYCMDNVVYVGTLEGEHIASIGDYIIKGVNGEFYPCKPDIFAKTYDMVSDNKPMSFGDAIKVLIDGKKVARKGWNGKGMFIYYVPPASYAAMTEVAKKNFGDMVQYNAYLAIKNINGTVSTWVPSINDCLAEDWEVVE